MPTYCTAQDVATYMSLTGPGGDEFVPSVDSKPSLAKLDALIEMQESVIESSLGHAYRVVQVENEIYDLTEIWHIGRGYIVDLAHRDVRDIDTDQNDKVEAWDGTQYYDISQDVTVNRYLGQIYVKLFSSYTTRVSKIRVTYRYGTETVPGWLRILTIKMTGIHLLETSWSMPSLAGNTEIARMTVERWREDVKKILNERAEFRVASY